MSKIVIAEVEFRRHTLVPPGKMIIVNLKNFSLVEQQELIAFVAGDEEVIANMRDPSILIKHVQEMKEQGRISL